MNLERSRCCEGFVTVLTAVMFLHQQTDRERVEPAIHSITPVPKNHLRGLDDCNPAALTPSSQQVSTSLSPGQTALHTLTP